MVRFEQIVTAAIHALYRLFFRTFIRHTLPKETAMKKLPPITLALSITLMACSLATSLLNPSETQDGSPSPSPLSAGQPSPTPEAPVKIMQEPVQCPVPEGPTSLPEPHTFADLHAEILTALNSGLVAQDLAAWLSSNYFAQSEQDVVQADFDGNGFMDIAVSIHNPETIFVQPPGQLLVYLCLEDKYEPTLETSTVPGLSAPIFMNKEDLTGDGAADLVIGEQNCGAHTCFMRLQALVWHQDHLTNQLAGSSEDLPYPTVDVKPQSGEIILTSGSYGSVGAGPQQALERRWQWSPGQDLFVIVGEEYLPSAYRIHVLHDADRMVADGNLQGALDAYARVIAEDGLLDWVDPVIERANLSVFAAFRQMQVALVIGDEEVAAERRQTLIAVDDDSVPGSGYRRLADVYWIEYLQDGQEAACSAVAAYARLHEEDVLAPLYFGYGNLEYGPDEMCLPEVVPANP